MDNINKKSEYWKNLPLADRVSRLALTPLVTASSIEGTFSKLKLVKKHLKTTKAELGLIILMMLTR